jgi:hypothetical protein
MSFIQCDVAGKIHTALLFCTACGVRHSPARQFASPTRVVDFVNYGSSLYSELQGGCGRWRFLSIFYYLLPLIYYLSFLAGG